jgi:hypothetical protein
MTGRTCLGEVYAGAPANAPLLRQAARRAGAFSHLATGIVQDARDFMPIHYAQPPVKAA